MSETPKAERTFADDMREEEERLRRRFVHATRPRHPLSMREALELSARMRGEKIDPNDFPDLYR